MIYNLLIVLGIIVTVLIISTAFFLFIPFYFGADFSWFKTDKQGNLLFWFLNSSFFLLRYDIRLKKLIIKFAGFKITKRQESVKEEEFKATPQKPHRETVSERTGKVRGTETGSQKEPVESQINESGLETEGIEEIHEIKEKKGEEKENSISQEAAGKSEEKLPDLLTRLKNNKLLFFLKEKKLACKIFKWIFRIIKKILKVVSFKRLHVKANAGVEDPALLGKIYGYIEAIKYGSNSGKNFRLEFTPVFMQNYLECRGSVSLRSSLWKFLLPLIVALVTFPYLSTLVVWLRYKSLTKQRRKKNEKIY